MIYLEFQLITSVLVIELLIVISDLMQASGNVRVWFSAIHLQGLEWARDRTVRISIIRVNPNIF